MKLAAICLAAALATGCVSQLVPHRDVAEGPVLVQAMGATQRDALLDDIERAHFQFFVDNSDPQTGLTKDRSTQGSAASIACSGFALTAYPIAVQRGWIDRTGAAAFTRRVLATLTHVPQGPDAQGVGGYHGWFYHFLDMKTGLRTWNCELSTIDTALLMAGVRFARNYYDRPEEADIRAQADQLFNGIDFPWALNGGPLLSMGWFPDKGFIPAVWQAYNESMILLLLGLGQATHPLPPQAWGPYEARVAARPLYGETHVPFGPQFGHQYSHGWVDFRGINDATTRRMGFDWFENACRATRAQHNYALANPKGWKGYGALDWGLTACDGPGGAVTPPPGVTFLSYAARGIDGDPDDGTIAPTAAAASLPYAPELVLPTLAHWRQDRPDLWGRDGFADAFNPTAGWVDTDRLGIDQGPIVLMLENYRTGFVWNVMHKDPVLRAGLGKAGFSGGWLGS